MVTDRITLNLIALYLDQFQQNQGTIDSIEISKVTKSFGSPKSLASFQDLRSFKQFVNQNAPLVTTEEIECFPLSLYELKSFNVTIDLGTSTSSKNFVINNNRTFQTDSKNIASANGAAKYIINEQVQKLQKAIEDSKEDIAELKKKEADAKKKVAALSKPTGESFQPLEETVSEKFRRLMNNV